MMKRKICVVTGSRADYGLLYWLLRAIKEDTALKLQIAATGAHVSPRHGSTYKVIEADGFRLSAKVPILGADDSPSAIANALSKGVAGFAKAFKKLNPDIVVVLGDRYEMLAAAQAAMLACVPIAHIHGGESSEGAIDEAIRHAITKMAHFHFVSAEAYRRRVIRMGEEPSRVFNFGAPGLDQLKRMNFLSASQLEKELGVDLGRRPLLLVTYHPATLDKKGPGKALSSLFGALDHFKRAAVIITKSNADTGGLEINRRIDAYVSKNREWVHGFISLGQKKYLSLMRQTDVVVGNSSSGIFEAPALKVPTVNLGDRQRGRLKDRSVIDCAESKPAIICSIQKVLSKKFRHSLSGMRSVYGSDGKASLRIKQKLKTVSLKNVLMKKFYEAKGKR